MIVQQTPRQATRHKDSLSCTIGPQGTRCLGEDKAGAGDSALCFVLAYEAYLTCVAIHFSSVARSLQENFPSLPPAFFVLLLFALEIVK